MDEQYSEEKESQLMNTLLGWYGQEVFTPGLERSAPLYEPFKKWIQAKGIKVTIIAGTNGKGQTAHTLAHFLKKNQLKVGLWTSPHILSLRERFHFDEDIDYDCLSREMHLAHEDLQIHFKELKVSFYEFLFLVFLRLCQKQDHLKHLILEVGLGGRLDAVNHFDADCSCITSISRDHQSILGNRYDLILKEKIAVARKDRPLFTQFNLKYLNDLTEAYCHEHGVLWKPLVKTPLDYFRQNQAMAIALFDYLVPGHSIDKNIAFPEFKGRREVMTFNQKSLIFIGAHNTDGVRKMVDLLKSDRTHSPDLVLASFSRRPKDEVITMVKTMNEFFGIEATLGLTFFEHPKALEKDQMVQVEEEFHRMNKGMLTFVTDWKKELISSQYKKILICGSYYFIGEVQRFIMSVSH